MNAPLTTDEAGRLDALRDYGVFETDPEIEFDRIAALAARTLNAPIAFVTLIGKETQWLKACHGLTGIRETTRDIAFCAYTILQDDVLIVPDATLDPRFNHNPLVTDWPHVRFYAGCPLRTPSGHNVGTLCVIDTVPHTISPEMRNDLRELAARVIDALELRKSRRLLQEMQRV